MKIKKWDVLEHLRTEADRAGYIEACRAENDPVLLAAALEAVLTALDQEAQFRCQQRANEL